jgi:chaperonin GroES
MSHQLIALEDHILVEPTKEESTTASGIILPSDDKEKPSKGTVIAVGTGKILDNGQRGPMDVSVGDTVYFTKYSPDELELVINGEKKKVLVIRHSSLLAKEGK